MHTKLICVMAAACPGHRFGSTHVRGLPTVLLVGSITEPDDVARLLNMLDAYQGTATVRAALKLAPLVFVRPKELGVQNGLKLILINKNGVYQQGK